MRDMSSSQCSAYLLFSPELGRLGPSEIQPAPLTQHELAGMFPIVQTLLMRGARPTRQIFQTKNALANLPYIVDGTTSHRR